MRDMNLTGAQPKAVITMVSPGSSGQRAGLRPGDVVTKLGAEAVRNAAFLRTRIALLRVGETAELEILREGKPMTVRAVMTERQSQTSSK